MLTRWVWNDTDSTFTLMDEFRRRLDHLFEDLDGERYQNRQAEGWTTGWPRAVLVDTGEGLMLRAEVPGLADKDIHITINQDVLTLTGERHTDIPQGYTIHRRERPDLRFSRSFALPCKVDLERCTATVKNGLLAISLPKAAEAQPRQISVKSV